MKEPISLAENLHVLVIMDGRTHIITREQALAITAAQNSGGAVKTFSIGNSPVTIHQVSSMPTLDVYRRQMKTKLAERSQRMCRRCGSILHIADRCVCRDNDSPALMEIAAKENPKLLDYFKKTGLVALALPEPKVPELPDAPPTAKEKAQMKVIQAAKDKFLGRATPRSLPDCSTCKNERRYPFEGVMVNCDCVLAERSGTLKKVSPLAQ